MVSLLPSYVDTAFDDPELLQAALRLVSGDLGPALDLIAATRDQPHRRELAVDVLGAAGNVVLPALLAAEEERPDDVNLLLLLGSAQTTAGWEERGGKRAAQTTDAQFAGLRNFTERARQTLHRAAELAPNDVAPWAALMPVALGAPAHRDEAAEVYEEVVKRVPDLVNATWRRLQTKTAKWHGSHEEMFAFARSGVQGLPDGHPLLALVPIAHLEMHLDKMAKSGKWARKWEIATLSYWKKQRAEVDAVSDRLLAGAADQPYSLWAHQIFAMFYFQAEVKDRLAQHLAHSGQRAARWPWAYLGDPNKRFAAAQQMARS